MNLLRRIQNLLDPQPQAYTATAAYPAPNPAGGTEIEPTGDDRRVIAAMAFFAGHDGVPDHDTPGFPAHHDPAGALR